MTLQHTACTSVTGRRTNRQTDRQTDRQTEQGWKLFRKK